MKTRRFALSVLCLLGITPISGSAAILTFAFEGHITGKHAPPGLLPFADLGAPVLYLFTFDEGAANTYPLPGAGTYGGISAELKVAGTILSCSPPRVSITDSDHRDVFDVSSPLDVSLPGLLPGGFTYFRLYNPGTNDPIEGIELPNEPYESNLFANREFAVSFYALPDPPGSSSELLSVYGQIDRFYKIPEPASLACFLWAGRLLVSGRRRRS